MNKVVLLYAKRDAGKDCKGFLLYLSHNRVTSVYSYLVEALKEMCWMKEQHILRCFAAELEKREHTRILSWRLKSVFCFLPERSKLKYPEESLFSCVCARESGGRVCACVCLCLSLSFKACEVVLFSLCAFTSRSACQWNCVSLKEVKLEAAHSLRPGGYRSPLPAASFHLQPLQQSVFPTDGAHPPSSQGHACLSWNI